MSLDQAKEDVLSTLIRSSESIVLSSGVRSDFYFDLRLLFGNPKALKNIAALINKVLEPYKSLHPLLCGVPNGAIPIATACSLESGCPFVVLSKEKKRYGMKKRLEGKWEKGDAVVLIDDVWTTGTSLRRTQKILEEELGLKVVHKIVIFWRGTKKPLNEEVTVLLDSQEI
jgi:orotate phosphoribosyltransferase